MSGKLLPPALVRSIPFTLALLVAAPWPAAAQPVEHETYLVQVVLLVADSHGDSSLDGLSEPVRHALEEVRDLLPFESYRLHDAGVVRASRAGAIALSGPEGSSYLAQIDVSGSGEQSEVRFELHDLWRTNDGMRAEKLLGAAFSVRPRQPVVVGTSKLGDGGGTLVVLLTLLPREV